MTKNLPRSQYYTRQLHAEYLGKESYSTTSQCFPVWKLERHGDNVESCYECTAPQYVMGWWPETCPCSPSSRQ